MHILSITEGPPPPSHRLRRDTNKAPGVLVLVATESGSGRLVAKETLTSSIRDNIDVLESVIGGNITTVALLLCHHFYLDIILLFSVLELSFTIIQVDIL